MKDQLIAPHGGELIINMASEKERAALEERARSLPQLQIGSRQMADLEMLAIGAYSPLGGFMTQADYLSVVTEMHLSNGLPWSIPITLSTSSEQAASLYDAHSIFAEFDPAKLGITPMFFDYTFFCRACDSMASSKTCPHGNEHHVTLSGTKVRQMLRSGEMPPCEFSRPEVAKVLMEAMRQGKDQRPT